MQHLSGKETRNCKFHDPPPTTIRGYFRVKSVKLMYFFKNLFLYLGAWFRQTKCLVMMTTEKSTRIVNFVSPRAGVLCQAVAICHTVKMDYSFKIFFLYSQAQIRQTNHIVIMTREGSTKIVIFMTRTRGSCAMEWPYNSYSEKAFFLLKNLLLYSHAQIRQTKYKVIMTYEGSTKL